MKYILIVAGFASLGLGILGIFLPLLPTTPFLLLSAALFGRSSERLYNQLLTHKILGGYIRDFLNERAVPLRIKVLSISALWITIGCTVFPAAGGRLWLQILLPALAAGVTAHILSYKTKRK